ncbi:MAG: hypothetical protein HGA66_04510, partial [Holophaga sp.]|nr:hypothetical protein [Holophaga sp.]
LNGYQNYWDTFINKDLACLRYFQAAHKHRAACNTLTYGWAANIRADRAPTLVSVAMALRTS